MFKVYIVVKIEQNYYVFVVYVNNVLCVVGVCILLLFDEQCFGFIECLDFDYECMCDQYVCKMFKLCLVMLEQVCVNKVVLDWVNYMLFVFVKLGVYVFENIVLVILCFYIDWMFFFMIWLFMGKYFVILEYEEVGEEVKCLFYDVNVLFDKVE